VCMLRAQAGVVWCREQHVTHSARMAAVGPYGRCAAVLLPQCACNQAHTPDPQASTDNAAARTLNTVRWQRCAGVLLPQCL
jgi:hypothetical protein